MKCYTFIMENLEKILEELREFESFTVEQPTDIHSMHIRYVLKTKNPQAMVKSLELLRQTHEMIFWVYDDETVLLGWMGS